MLAAGYDFLVFDLDGTLADTSRDLASSVNYALATVDRPPMSVQAVVRHVGNGARRLIERSLDDDLLKVGAGRVEAILETFLDHYRAHCLVDTRLYPGVAEVLAALGRKPLAVLTNKPLGPARKILSGLGVLERFRRVEGGDSAPAKKPDPQGLVALMEAFGTSPERTLVVGDSSIDVRTARAGGTHVAGVTYGFRPEEFEEFSPDFLLDSMRDLLR
jgi:phosphoglycolate phosphatase